MSGAMRSSLAMARSRLASRLRVHLAPSPIRGFADSAYMSREEVTNRVLNVVKNFPKVDILKLSPAAHFQKDLGLDSLDAVEVVMALEDEFKVEIPDSDSDKIVSCADAIEYIATRPKKIESLIHQ